MTRKLVAAFRHIDLVLVDDTWYPDNINVSPDSLWYRHQPQYLSGNEVLVAVAGSHSGSEEPTLLGLPWLYLAKELVSSFQSVLGLQPSPWPQSIRLHNYQSLVKFQLINYPNNSPCWIKMVKLENINSSGWNEDTKDLI